MRVLFCALEYPPSPGGGAEKQAQLQAEELVRIGHDVHVVCQETGHHVSGFVNGVWVQRLPRIDRRMFRTISYLIVLAGFLVLRLRRFDVVHVHLANAQADVAVAVANILRRPSFVKLAAGGPLGEVGRFKSVAKVTRYYGIRHASAVQAISEEIACDLRQIGIDAKRIRAIPNGVRIREPHSACRRTARSRLGLPEDDLVVLFSGRMERDKGVGDLLQMWRAFRPPGGRLVLVGSSGIKDPVDVSALPPGAEYRGWTRDLEDFLLAADIFVLPSYAEGMSNALLEAMTSGIACIATRVGAAEEMIQDQETGLLVRPGNIGELADAMDRLAADVALRTRLGEAARLSVNERYGIDSVVKRIVDAYRSILPAS